MNWKMLSKVTQMGGSRNTLHLKAHSRFLLTALAKLSVSRSKMTVLKGSLLFPLRVELTYEFLTTSTVFWKLTITDATMGFPLFAKGEYFSGGRSGQAIGSFCQPIN